MQFEPHDEALAASVAQQAPKLFPFSAQGRRGSAFERSKWQELADLGWLALCLPEAADGLGLPLSQADAILQAVGRHLALLPYGPSLVAATVLAACERHTELAQLGRGERLIVPALREASAAAGAAPQHCQATWQVDGSAQLSGAVQGLPWGDEADDWLLAATLPDGQTSIWLLPRHSSGLQVQAYAGLDDKRWADAQLSAVALPASACLAQGAAAQALLHRAEAVAIAATCAEAVGSMGALFEQTLDYVKTRQQFGRAIGSFQAVQHRLADMLVKLELARSMAGLALHMAAEVDGQQGLPRHFHAAKVQTSQAARFFSEQAVQLHGGMGLTNECQASHHARRLLALDKLQGDARWHLRQMAAAL